MKGLVVVPLVLVMTGFLVACASTPINPSPAAPAIQRSQSFIWVGMTTEQVIDDAEAILMGKVTSLSPSRWNQDSGEYWEDDSDMALQYYEVTLEVTDAVVDEIGFGDRAIITVLGPSPADLAPRTDSEVQHTQADSIPFQEGEKVLLFIEKVPLAWRSGLVERVVLVGGPQGKYTITDDGRALNACMSKRDSTLSALLEQIAARRYVEP